MADMVVELIPAPGLSVSQTGCPPKKRNLYEKSMQPCVAEFVGTLFFVFVGCVSVIENVEAGGRLQPALVHGLAVAVLVGVFAEISGAHFNPVVTLAVYLVGGLDVVMVFPYVLFQMLGGLMGAALSKALTSKKHFTKASGAAFSVVQVNEQVAGALLCEILMTCFLVIVVCLGAVNEKSRSPLISFLVGCTVIVNILAGADLSGVCMNPARAFGPAVVSGYWNYQWIYWVGPIAGALVAAAVLRLLLGDKKTRLYMK